MFLSLASEQLRAQETGTLRGVVVDSVNGIPIPGASVAVGTTGRAVTTDDHGRFTISRLAMGPLTIHIRAVGFLPVERTIDLSVTSDEVRIALTLQTFEIGPVVVSGQTESEQRLRQERSSVTLDAQQIAIGRGQTLGETIKEAPGVAVVQYGPSIAKPVVRGLHSHRIIVMNSGVRQEGQQWGGEHAPEIDTFGANEIEVIRGAGAVLYGSDALGGVVRVEPRPLPEPGAGFGGEIALNGFTNNRQGAGSVLVEGPIVGTAAFRFRASRRRAGDARTPQYVLDNTGFSETDFAGAIGVKPSWGHSEVLYSRFDTDIGLYSGAHVGNFDDLLRAMERGPRETDFSYEISQPRQAVRHDLVTWRTRLTTLPGVVLETNLAYQFNRREEFDNHGPLAARDIPAFALDLHTYTVDIRGHHASIGPVSGTIGVSGMRQGNISRGKSFLIPQYRLYTGGVYALEEAEIGRLKLSAGLRYDYRWQHVFEYSDAGVVSPDEIRTYDGVSGQLGASFLLSDAWSVAASLGRAWRAPNVSERFSQGVHHGTAQYEIGDTSLVNEETLNVDFTLRYGGSRGVAEVSGFVNNVNNYIFLEPRDPVLTIRGAFPGYNFRQTDARLYGFDASVDLSFTRWLELSAGASVIRGWDKTTDNPLFDMPADRLNVAARYLFPVSDPVGFYIEGGAVLVRQQDHVPPVTVYALPTDGYRMVNAEIGVRRLTIGHTPIEASVTVRNVFDVAYRDYLSRYKLFADDAGRDIVVRFRALFGSAR